MMNNQTQPPEQNEPAVVKYDGSCKTPMADHVARFWQLLTYEHVRILVFTRRDHDDGLPFHWDSASFPNDVAKAMANERAAAAAMLAALIGIKAAIEHEESVLSYHVAYLDVRSAISKAIAFTHNPEHTHKQVLAEFEAAIRRAVGDPEIAPASSEPA